MNTVLRILGSFLIFVVASAITTDLFAQVRSIVRPSPPTPAKRTESAPAKPKPFDADASMNRLITQMVLKHMPHTYSRDKDWGKQAERWDGIKWDTDGWRIKTKRRKKKVNHGTWRKYSASLMDPQRRFDVKLTNIRQNKDDKLAFQLTFTTQIKLDARQSEWVKGLQMYSLSAEGKASVRLAVDMVLGITMDPTKFPPDLIFEPEATAADIIVDDFRIDRVSKLGGEFAIQVTRLARRELDKEIAEKEVELVQKINKEIDDERDKLKLSLSDAVSSKWADKARPFLPAKVKQAVEDAAKK